MRFIDLFAGLGGFRVACQQADPGSACVFSSEILPAARECYRLNFGELPTSDIWEVEPASIPDHDLLLAGFPCQPFSGANTWGRRGTAHRSGNLFMAIAEILKAKQPPTFLLENVRGLQLHEAGRTFRHILEILYRLGYSVHWQVLNSVDFGVMQERRRLFIVGFREPVPFRWPTPTGPGRLAEILEAAAEEDVALRLTEAQRERVRRMWKVPTEPPARPFIMTEEKGRHGNRLGKRLPYATTLLAFTSNLMLINEERHPSRRELLRLQGFPDTYRPPASLAQCRSLVGNSVSVPVVRAVLEAMTEAMKGKAGPPAAGYQADLLA